MLDLLRLAGNAATVVVGPGFNIAVEIAKLAGPELGRLGKATLLTAITSALHVAFRRATNNELRAGFIDEWLGTELEKWGPEYIWTSNFTTELTTRAEQLGIAVPLSRVLNSFYDELAASLGEAGLGNLEIRFQVRVQEHLERHTPMATNYDHMMDIAWSLSSSGRPELVNQAIIYYISVLANLAHTMGTRELRGAVLSDLAHAYSQRQEWELSQQIYEKAISELGDEFPERQARVRSNLEIVCRHLQTPLERRTGASNPENRN